MISLSRKIRDMMNDKQLLSLDEIAGAVRSKAGHFINGISAFGVSRNMKAFEKVNRKHRCVK